ncbi:hypothetical protein [Candidatus Villigracilis saccharophilus]|uniref:hypothetical protein n=1 Tax=Candidatus Villigracilis saccharophilus TaxID=3140684 RepID=UPI003136B41F|nr:hypothetical protein [Anaerolineales bacterium]
MNRQEILAQIKDNPESSVLIIGAGINGIGTFRDLGLNGVDVLLIDRGDFALGRVPHPHIWRMAVSVIWRTVNFVWCGKPCANVTA